MAAAGRQPLVADGQGYLQEKERSIGQCVGPTAFGEPRRIPLTTEVDERGGGFRRIGLTGVQPRPMAAVFAAFVFFSAKICFINMSLA